MSVMIKTYNKQDLVAELNKSKKVFAVFYASWCPHCLKFLPIFQKKVDSLIIKKVIYVLLDDYDNPLWDYYNISAVPTIIFFDDAKICKRLDAKLGVGLSEKEFKTWIEEFE